MSIRKQKVEEADAKRKAPTISLGKNTAANSFVPTSEDTEAPPMTSASETLPKVTNHAKIVNAKREVNNPTTIKAPTVPTISDMLAERRNELRKSVEKDKTDAVKMQKYYALTDALGALGKMGGTAIGGAIGGNMMDSAPIVADYQPSRGYVNAFEKARQANERLRSMDERDFQLVYAKRQRDEERANQQKIAKEEREYKAKMDALDKKYQKEMIEYKAQLEQAIAQGNMELKAKLDADFAAKQHEYNVELAKVKGQYNLDEKKLGLTTSEWQANEYNRTPVRTKGGQIVNVPNNTMRSIEASLIGETVNGVKVTKDNALQVIMKNADEILPSWGISIPTAANSISGTTTGAATTPTQAVANNAFIEAQHTEPSVPKKTKSSSSNGKTTELPDISKFEEKK